MVVVGVVNRLIRQALAGVATLVHVSVRGLPKRPGHRIPPMMVLYRSVVGPSPSLPLPTSVPHQRLVRGVVRGFAAGTSVPRPCLGVTPSRSRLHSDYN